MALPPGFGIEEMRCLLEQSGVGFTVKKKPDNASHLNSSEVQFCLRGHKVTSGIIDHDSNKKKRVNGNIHAYVKASPKVMDEAVNLIPQMPSCGGAFRPALPSFECTLLL